VGEVGLLHLDVGLGEQGRSWPIAQMSRAAFASIRGSPAPWSRLHGASTREPAAWCCPRPGNPASGPAFSPLPGSPRTQPMPGQQRAQTEAGDRFSWPRAREGT